MAMAGVGDCSVADTAVTDTAVATPSSTTTTIRTLVKRHIAETQAISTRIARAVTSVEARVISVVEATLAAVEISAVEATSVAVETPAVAGTSSLAFSHQASDKSIIKAMSAIALSVLALLAQGKDVPTSDPSLQLSPYNWVRESGFVQTPNPGAYIRLGFTGTSVQVKLDNSTFAGVPANQFPLIRYSVDNGPGTTIQLKPGQQLLDCANGLKEGNHTIRLDYVSGYVFLDFWTPINVVRVTGFTIDKDASTFTTSTNTRDALFLGDSITNGDDNVANYKDGITNAVETQDATIGYPAVVAAATQSEYGIVAYGGASWDRTAADGHTPGLMTFWDKIDKTHSRLEKSKSSVYRIFSDYKGSFNPVPDDIYVNMGENRPPSGDDVINLLYSLQRASAPSTNIFIIVPFSGRARTEIFRSYVRATETFGDRLRIYLLDLSDNPYLKNQGPTLFSVDGQHPSAALHGQLGAQIVEARAKALAKKN